MKKYLPRVVDAHLTDLMQQLPALAIEGAKGVGKTETAKQQAKSALQLDSPEQAEILAADPSILENWEIPILLDEWQRFPRSWDLVRRAVDNDYSPNRFLLTGSANPANPPTHSGAGRIATLRMRPLTLYERQIESPTVSFRDVLNGDVPPIEGTTSISLQDYANELMNPGLPGLRHLRGRALRSQMTGYLNRIVDRDIPEFGLGNRSSSILLRWMRAYAASTATTATFETIREAATGGEGEKPSRKTSETYREILERLWILDPIPAWLPSQSSFSGLTQAPKHHLLDPALATHLLGIDLNTLKSGPRSNTDLTRMGALLGRLFESIVTLSVRVFSQAADAETMHMRTRGGRQEIDLIVVRPDQSVVAIEVKLSSAVSEDDVKNLHWLKRKLGDQVLDLVVVNTGSYAYRRSDSIAVVPAALLGP